MARPNHPRSPVERDLGPCHQHCCGLHYISSLVTKQVVLQRVNADNRYYVDTVVEALWRVNALNSRHGPAGLACVRVDEE